MVLFILVAGLALLGVAAQVWGADSRDVSIDGREPAAHTGLI
jgi:hypothetical protein